MLPMIHLYLKFLPRLLCPNGLMLAMISGYWINPRGYLSYVVWEERRSYYHILGSNLLRYFFLSCACSLSFSLPYLNIYPRRLLLDLVVFMRINNKVRMSTKQTSPSSGKNKILYQVGARLEAMDFTLNW